MVPCIFGSSTHGMIMFASLLLNRTVPGSTLWSRGQWAYPAHVHSMKLSCIQSRMTTSQWRWKSYLSYADSQIRIIEALRLEKSFTIIESNREVR